ncbi:unnamed protein product [Mytilus edulis]|uniref:Uncharacterized protein n=1 Tax=Mytilus edulis TaxID=6550 RepID=A0A8S3RPM0_MYTED|nr:unnamed protein product [Mytilus edulis]
MSDCEESYERTFPEQPQYLQLDLEQPSAQGHAQGPRLPASASKPYSNATPTGEVPIRVKKAGEGCYERQEQRWRFYGDKVAAGLVARERTINQQVSHGRGDIHINTGIGDVENQRLTGQRASFPRLYSPSRSEERATKDLTGVKVLQKVSQGPKWTHTVPSEGMRGNPWKIHTGTEDHRECTGHAQESFRTVPTGGDIIGYRDNQGFSQGSYGMTNDYGVIIGVITRLREEIFRVINHTVAIRNQQVSTEPVVCKIILLILRW